MSLLRVNAHFVVVKGDEIAVSALVPRLLAALALEMALETGLKYVGTVAAIVGALETPDQNLGLGIVTSTRRHRVAEPIGVLLLDQRAASALVRVQLDLVRVRVVAIAALHATVVPHVAALLLHLGTALDLVSLQLALVRVLEVAVGALELTIPLSLDPVARLGRHFRPALVIGRRHYFHHLGWHQVGQILRLGQEPLLFNCTGRGKEDKL